MCDLDNLTLATPELNHEKSARDAAESLPEHNRCWFAVAIVVVRKGVRAHHRPP